MKNDDCDRNPSIPSTTALKVRFTSSSASDGLKTFGGYGVFEIQDLQELLRYICENGFEHHVATNRSLVAASIEDAFANYLGWDVYRH